LGWNSAPAVVCGDAVVWKPASKTPLTALAVTRLAEQVCRRSEVDSAIFTLTIGSSETVGERMIADARLPLISATGSCKMGHHVAETVHRRLGRTIMELGGNNAVIVTPGANLELALRAIFFGAIGTAGQRCTSTRRVIVHESVRNFSPDASSRLQVRPHRQPVGSRHSDGPLIDRQAVETMQQAMVNLERQGGEIILGGERLKGSNYPGGCYVTPCLASAQNDFPVVQEETFAPLLYLVPYRNLDEALTLNNAVRQGLTSAIFTSDLSEAEEFLSARAVTAASPTSTAAPAAPKLAARLGARRRAGVAAKAAAMRGRTTCAPDHHR